jgi:ribonuclease P protein component
MKAVEMQASSGGARPRSKAEAACNSGGGFPRSARLLNHAAFDQVYRQGKRVFSANLTVFFLRREDAAGPRIGFTVSRVLGGAVERNRIRRRMREAVRKYLSQLNAPVDVVINPKKSVLKMDFGGLRKETERVFATVQQRAR